MAVIENSHKKREKKVVYGFPENLHPFLFARLEPHLQPFHCSS
jgi:hypothetical protein